MNGGSLNIFILEDAPERISWFQNTFSDCKLSITSNVEQACDMLRGGNFDLVFLDRDLGHPQLNGEDVAWCMKQENLAQNSCIVVHSVNPRGQRVIQRYLQDRSNLHSIPFPQLMNMKREDFR
jgi:CheY-like chemotaxis protein